MTEQEDKIRWAALYARLKVGDVVTGKVIFKQSFGVFMDMQGCDLPDQAGTLLEVYLFDDDFAWSTLFYDQVQLGDTITAVVLAADERHGIRVSTRRSDFEHIGHPYPETPWKKLWYEEFRWLFFHFESCFRIASEQQAISGQDSLWYRQFYGYDGMKEALDELTRKRLESEYIQQHLAKVIAYLPMDEVERATFQATIKAHPLRLVIEKDGDQHPAFPASKCLHTCVALHLLDIHLMMDASHEDGKHRFAEDCLEMASFLRNIRCYGWVGESFEQQLDKLADRWNCVSARRSYHELPPGY